MEFFFLNTLNEREESIKKKKNLSALLLYLLLLNLFFQAGCKPSDMGVITPYRQQLKTISALLQSSVFTGVEVNTVDRYQGRDKSLIVLSFVRSTAEEGTVSLSHPLHPL